MSDESDEGSLVMDVANAAGSAADSVISAFTTPDPAGPSGASLKVAEGPLKEAIKAALKIAKDTAHSTSNGAGDQSSAAADPIVEALGEALGTAIHDYFMNAWVDITQVQSIAAPGVVCETIGIPPIRPVAAGATIIPIIAIHHAAPNPISGKLWGKLK
jgi:hypothetical protein